MDKPEVLSFLEDQKKQAEKQLIHWRRQKTLKEHGSQDVIYGDKRIREEITKFDGWVKSLHVASVVLAHSEISNKAK